MKHRVLLLLLLIGAAFAQPPPSGYEAVKEGEHWKFTDPVYGYSLTFSDDFVLEANADAMREVAEHGKEVLLSESAGLRPRFTLINTRLMRPDFVPSMNATVHQMPPSALSPDQFYAAARSEIESGLQGAVVTGEQRVEIHGTSFHRVDYQFPIPALERLAYARCYCFYDQTSGLAYAFTLGSSGPRAQQDMEVFEAPMSTVRLVSQPRPKEGGPVGVRR